MLYLERENGTQSRKWEGTPKNRPAAAVQRDTAEPVTPASDAGSAPLTHLQEDMSSVVLLPMSRLWALPTSEAGSIVLTDLQSTVDCK